MAKILKSTRKQQKSLKDVYLDAQIKWVMSLDYNKTPQDIGDIRELEKDWLKAGGRKKEFYRLGANKCRQILTNKIQCKALFR